MERAGHKIAQGVITALLCLSFVAGFGQAHAYDPGDAGPLKQSPVTRQNAICGAKTDKPLPPACALPAVPGTAATAAAPAHIARGLNLFDQKRFKRAGEEFRQAVAINPKSHKTQLMAARHELAMLELHFDRKYLDTAEPFLQRAEKHQPGNADVMSTRAFVLWYRMRHYEALDLLGKVLKADPKHVFAREWRARMHSEKDRWKPALADYDVLILLKPKEVKWRYSRANILLRLNRYAPAISDLSAYLESKPYSQMAYVSRAVAHHRIGNHASALQDLDIVLDGFEDGTKFVLAADGRAALLMRRAFLHLKLQQFDQAVTDALTSTSLGGAPRILKLKLYLKRHGFQLKIDDKVSPELEKAIRKCFGRAGCSEQLFTEA